MREVMSSTQARRLKLIELLNETDNWVHIDYLTEALDCSDRTIHMDVEEILDLFPNITIESIPKQYRMKFNEGFNMQIVNQQFLNQISILNLVERMLYKPVETLEEVSEIVFTSTASFYRMLSSLNKFLKNKYNIVVKGRPYQLEGDEIDIRYFYAQLFAEKYAVTDWPFKVIEEAPFNDFIYYCMERVGVPINFASFRYVKIVTAINLLRMQTGQLIEDIPSSFSEKYQAVKNHEQFNVFSDYIKESFGLQSDEATLYNLFVAFGQDDFYFNYEDFLQASQEDEAINQSRLFLINLFEGLQAEHEITLDNLDNMVLNIYNTSNLEKQEIASSFLLYNRKQKLCEQFELLNTEIYSDIREGLIEFRKVNGQNLDEDMLYHLIYSVFVNWPRLFIQIEAKKKKVNVVVISEYDPNHIKACVEILDYNTSDQMVIKPFTDHLFDYEKVKASDFDIIVSNFHINPIEGKQIVFFNDTIDEEIINEVQYIAHKILMGR